MAQWLSDDCFSRTDVSLIPNTHIVARNLCNPVFRESNVYVLCVFLSIHIKVKFKIFLKSALVKDSDNPRQYHLRTKGVDRGPNHLPFSSFLHSSSLLY